MWSKSQKTASSTSSVAPSAIDTLIGTQCRIQGDIFSQQSIKIDGQITGNVQAGGMVIVGENGVINGDIRSHELMVFGKVEGLVEVDKLQLKKHRSCNWQYSHQVAVGGGRRGICRRYSYGSKTCNISLSA